MMLLDNLKKYVMEGYSETEKTELKDQEIAREDWLTQRIVKLFEIGQKIEVLELPDIWNPATVLEKMKGKNGKSLLKIHFDGWSDNYDEIISEKSRRIVPTGLALMNVRLLIRSKTISIQWNWIY